MTELAERIRWAEPVRSVSTPDGSNLAELYVGEQADGLHRVIAYNRRPVRSEPFNANSELRQVEKTFAGYDEDQSLVRCIGHQGDLQDFADLAEPTALLKVLGYGWSVERAKEKGVSHRWTEFSYPTTKRSNGVLDELIPGEGLRYAPYPGGVYAAEESAEALVDNLVYVADNMHMQLHDHVAPHVLGFMMLKGELLDEIRGFTQSYLERFLAEVELPPVPGINRRRIQNLLHPAHQVLRGIQIGLDNASSSLGNTIFLRDESDEFDGGTLLSTAVDYVLDIYNMHAGPTSSPVKILITPDEDTIERYAVAIEERYTTLEARAQDKLDANQ